VTNLESRSRIPRLLVRLGLQSPRAVLVGWTVIAIAAGVGVAKLRIETSTDSVLDRSGSGWQIYQDSQRRFGGDEILTLLIDGESPFDVAALREVVRVSEEFRDLAGVGRVDSLSTVPLIRATVDGDLSLEPALADGVPESAAGMEQFARRIRADRIAPRTLLSPDESAFAVNLVLEKGAEDFYGSVLSAVESSVEGLQTSISGVPVFRIAADSRTRSELALFVPMTILVIALVLALLFGTPQAVVIPLASSGLGTWIMLGAMGMLEVPLAITTVILPSVLLALGCAYSVHLLSAVCGAPASERAEALLTVSLPVALSGLTTTLGFLAITFVRIEAIRNIGIFGAFGVLSVLAVTLTAGPAALTLWPHPPRRVRFQQYIQDRATPALLGLVVRNRRSVMAVWLAVMAAVSIGLTRLEIETDVILWFQRDDPIRIAYEKIRDRLSGISPLNVVVESVGDARMTSPEVFRAIDRLSTFLEGLPAVGRSLSIADPLRQIHGGLSGDASLPLPSDEALIGQYLLLLESKRYINDFMASDRSAANIQLRVNDNSSDALLSVAAKAESWWEQHGVAGYRARSTGIMYEFARAQDAIAWGQLKGLAFALLTILGILVAVFRWMRLALITLVPNVVPLAMGFGAMGMMGIPLDAGTVVIGNLVFGIAVDDSIHAVTGFLLRRSSGQSTIDSLASTYRNVLPPLVYTTATVTLGFTVLAMSGFAFVRHLGLLTASLMIICLLADSLLLPAMLSRLDATPSAISTKGS
jgi:predicted RND superfamily exporter protein